MVLHPQHLWPMHLSLHLALTTLVVFKTTCMIGTFLESLNKIHEKLCELYMVHLAAITEHCSSYKPSDQKATYNIYKAKHSQRNTTISYNNSVTLLGWCCATLQRTLKSGVIKRFNVLSISFIFLQTMKCFT